MRTYYATFKTPNGMYPATPYVGTNLKQLKKKIRLIAAGNVCDSRGVVWSIYDGNGRLVCSGRVH